MNSLLGQRIEWTITDGGRRSGVVWSAGPVAGTAWVIPDVPGCNEGHAVCVRIARDGAHTARRVDEQRSSADNQARALACLRFRMPVMSLFTPHIVYRDQKSHGHVLHGFENAEHGWMLLDRGAKDVRG